MVITVSCRVCLATVEPLYILRDKLGTGHLIFPLEGGCPLLGGDKLTIGNALVRCLEVVLSSEGPLSEIPLYI